MCSTSTDQRVFSPSPSKRNQFECCLFWICWGQGSWSQTHNGSEGLARRWLGNAEQTCPLSITILSSSEWFILPGNSFTIPIWGSFRTCQSAQRSCNLCWGWQSLTIYRCSLWNLLHSTFSFVVINNSLAERFPSMMLALPYNYQ